MAVDPTPDRRELLKNALDAIEQLKAKIRSLEAAAAEPIAIIGAGCRFPGGANTLDAYWSLLYEGRDVVGEISAERWEQVGQKDVEPGWQAGLVEGIDQFDPRFFGISAREATTMDPQQRMVLEVAWEALENAGQAPDQLNGTKTGVFLGVTGHDYADLLRESGGVLDVYAATGNANNAAAGRLSFLLGLQGPSLAVDTACSSSLVAIHLACLALKAGDCRMALAGGVNAVLAPWPFECFRNWGMMAPGGRCKTFDASADGFVRGEGCGFIVLKRLSHAQADGDRILAVIRGSAVNQDGRSSGLTVPNGPAQEAAVRHALKSGRVDPLDVSYVESHGTGTALGDPIEAHALAAVLGNGRKPDNPLVVGSVKTNIGHLESAAGIAGLLKVVLSMQHEHIPPHLHFTTMNPDIDWNDVPVDIPVHGRPWPRAARKRIAGVSSFGFSGTNAHIVLEEAPVAVIAEPNVAATIPERPYHLFTLAARADAARDQLAQQFAEYLERDLSGTLADICYTANTGRARLSERVAIVAATRDELRHKLSAKQWIEGHAKPGTARIAFLFTGQGSQWAGMARELYDTAPVFRQALDDCAARLPLKHSLLDVIYGPQGSLLDETEYTQPALFAIEWALAQLWKSWGVEPDVVFGHSVGEYVALCVAGVWSLGDGLRLIAERGRLMQALGPGWGMAAVQCSRTQAEAAVRGYEQWVSVAAANAPDSIVLSGRAEELQQVTQHLSAAGVQVKPLTVSHGFHSPQMASVAEAFAALATQVPMHEPQMRVVSSVTGQFISLQELRDQNYWRRQIRNAVEFQSGMESLAAAGYDTFLEIGPTPTLCGLGRQCIDTGAQRWAPSLRKDRGAWEQMLDSLGQLYVQGAAVDWNGFDAAYPRKRVALPTYPFQRQRYWIAPVTTPVRRSGGHPLLGSRTTIAGPPETHVWETTLSLETHPYLADHRVQGNIIVPATAYIEMGVAAARQVLHDGPIALTNAQFHRPLILDNELSAHIQISIVPAEGLFRVHGRTSSTAPWTLIASSGIERAESSTESTPSEDFTNGALQPVPGNDLYNAFERQGNQWGPTFRGISQAWLGETEGWTEITVPPSIANDLSRYWLHPAVADASGHVLTALTNGTRAAPSGSGESVRLTITERGELGNLRIEPAPRATPGAGQIEIEVRATGLNFRDVLNALGMYPGDPGPLGSECAGVVTAVGEGVTNVAIGDEVLAMVEDSFATYAIAQAALTARKPAAMTFEEAATIPIAFLTAAYALHTLGRIRAGDRVLIHAATGGVGMAAMQIAKRADATVFATAGSPAKRALAQSLGADHVSDSRSLQFADDIRTATNGEGVDIVLNSLANDFIPKSLELLHDGGRFIEIGKTGIWDQEKVSREYPGIEYFVLYLGEIGITQPEIIQQMLQDLVADFASGALTPLPQKVFALSNAEEAFRFMAQAKHVGKVVVVPQHTARQRSFVAQSIDRVTIYQRPQGGTLLSHGIVTPTSNPAALRGDVRLFDNAGQLVSEVSGVQMHALDFEPQDTTVPPAEQWYHRITWTEVPWPEASSPAIAGEPAHWFMITSPNPSASQQAVAAQLAGAIQSDGAQVTVVSVDEAATQLSNPAALLHVVYLAGLDTKPADDLAAPGIATHTTSLAGIARTLSTHAHSKLWIVTRGVHAIASTPDETSPWQAPLWGMGRAISVEEPGLWGGLIDLENLASDEPEVSLLWKQLQNSALGHDTEDQIALRNGRRFALRLERIQQPSAPPLPIRADGAYLITGALGGLGLEIARWLAQKGAHRLILWSRSPLPPRKEWATLPDNHKYARAVHVIRELETMGVSVHAAAVDVANPSDIGAFLDTYRAEAWPPILGIVHAAGVVEQVPLSRLTPEQLDATLRPKLGAWYLHRAFTGQPLDFFVMFSSGSALRSPPGLSAYAAANGFLDALAHYRAAHGLPALSINWGAWGETGMAARDGVNEHGERGMGAMSTTQGLDALERLLATSYAQAAVLPINWSIVAERYPAYTASPMFSALLETAHHTTTADVSLRTVLFTGSEEDRLRHIAEYLSGTLAAILGFATADVDPDTSIGELGLDSLTAVEFRNRINSAIGVSLPIVRLLQGPTITQLAADVHEAAAKIPQAPADRIHVTAGDTNHFVPSHGQRALWFLQKFFADTHAYNLAFAGWLSPQLDLAAFQHALHALAQRHPSLRSVFVTERGEPRIQILPDMAPSLELIECDTWPDDQLHAKALEYHQRAFALDGPLMRVTLFRQTARDLLVIDIHHLILDAHSSQIVFADLQALYEAALAGTAPSLAPLPTTYQDFVAAQEALLASATGAQLREYWDEVLRPPLPVLDIPTSYPRPPLLALQGASIPFRVDRTQAEALLNVAKSQQTTLFAVLMASMQVLLHALSQQRDIIIGTPVSLRTDSKWANVVGFFVNMLPIRGTVNPEETFPALLARTKETILGGLTHSELPFPVMVKNLGLDRELARSPVFQAMLNVPISARTSDLSRLFNPESGDALQFGSSELVPYLIRQQEGQFEIVIEVMDVEGELKGNVKYQTALYDATAAAQMTAMYLRILHTVAENPEIGIDALIGNDRETVEL